MPIALLGFAVLVLLATHLLPETSVEGVAEFVFVGKVSDIRDLLAQPGLHGPGESPASPRQR